MDTFGYLSQASTATNSSSSSRRESFSHSEVISPFQRWLISRNATHLIPKPLPEIEAIFTPLTNFYPEHWARPPFSLHTTHKILSTISDSQARPAQLAAKLGKCAQLGKVLWNLRNAEAARLLLVLDEILGLGVVEAQTVEHCFGNGSCGFYAEVRLGLGLEPLDRARWAKWWAKREAWVHDHRGTIKTWDWAVVKVLRDLAERRGQMAVK